jgi:hypothetical protein
MCTVEMLTLKRVMDTKYIAINDPGISDVVKTTDLGFLHQNIAKISANNAPKISKYI